ncbi:LysR substrate-binding domain-containing protein [Marinivivus vitaminiproducens]|uniref:LysR substrate-binding domain-containing protein n=1 Tax=Marinivivus vitaminiproducens TaxID=3035935 RepID=UPI00279F5674|nr:LysR substrate-binding domain-containing protein [Geminicoccaceae bacterium SCSIO 64248]
MLTPLQPDLLATFLAIAEGGSFTGAADRVRRTQSAVSMQVKRLESAIGRPLFERGAGCARLTPAGEALLPYAKRILRMHEEAWSAVANPEVAGAVRLGTPDDYASSLLPPVLARFAATFPRVEVQVRCESSNRLYDLVSRRELDLALVTRQPIRADLATVRYEPLVWISAFESSVHEHDPVPLAVFQPGCRTRELALRALTSADRRHRIAYSSPSLAGLLAVVDAGLAVAAVARCSVPTGLRVLGEKHGFPPMPPLELSVAQATLTPTAAVEALAGHIVDSLNEDPMLPSEVLVSALEAGVGR